jgi:3-phosphoshikimate 1-carboxyvinyltransferase
MRFLPPLAAMAKGIIHFDGDARSHERPLGPVIKALESLGVSIEHGARYCLPMTINANGQLRGGTIDVDATLSSQFISALLLVAPATIEGITVSHIGNSLPSLPHIEMTVAMLREKGVEVTVGQNEWVVKPSRMNGSDSVIEPDLSNAAPFMGAAMISGGTVVIKDWPRSTTQPGDELRNIFTQMGALVEFQGDDLAITGNDIHGIDIDLHDVGELTPSIAALCVFADSPSYLRGIAHLRTHETDRLSALATEINSLGGEVIEESSALRIIPRPLRAGIFHTYDDHR